jgi:hypothetical protein
MREVSTSNSGWCPTLALRRYAPDSVRHNADVRALSFAKGNSMKKAFVLMGLVITGCSSTGVVSTGPDTYMVAKSGGGPGASGAEISADLYREANAFCAAQKKQFVRISVTEQDNKPFVRQANAKLEFRCVAEGTPK